MHLIVQYNGLTESCRCKIRKIDLKETCSCKVRKIRYFLLRSIKSDLIYEETLYVYFVETLQTKA